MSPRLPGGGGQAGDGSAPSPGGEGRLPLHPQASMLLLDIQCGMEKVWKMPEQGELEGWARGPGTH